MEKMFIYVLDQAVTVSVVILAVILARLVLRRAPRCIVGGGGDTASRSGFNRESV